MVKKMMIAKITIKIRFWMILKKTEKKKKKYSKMKEYLWNNKKVDLPQSHILEIKHLPTTSAKHLYRLLHILECFYFSLSSSNVSKYFLMQLLETVLNLNKLIIWSHSTLQFTFNLFKQLNNKSWYNPSRAGWSVIKNTLMTLKPICNLCDVSFSLSLSLVSWTICLFSGDFAIKVQDSKETYVSEVLTCIKIPREKNKR